MVVPKEKEMHSETLEEGLYRKFGELQIAREDKDSTMFDEITKSIEVRLIAVPQAHQELMASKEPMLSILHEEKAKIIREAEQSMDVINRQKYLNQENYEIEWEFRDIYEEKIMSIMQKYRLVAMTAPSYGMLNSDSRIESEMVDEQEEQIPEEQIPEEQTLEEQQPPIQSKKKRPHLSIKR